MKVRFDSIGCRLNEAEVEHWARQLSARGAELATADEPIDLAVLNTCAVTAEALRKSRKRLRQLRRQHPDARLVVSGCAVSLDADAGLAATDIDLCVHNRDKDRLAEIVAARWQLPPPAPASAAQALFARGRQRAFVKIQDGCRHACAFCVATRARGPERSRPLRDIVAQVQRLVDEGVQEIVLTGVHGAGYGADLGTDLSALIAALFADTDVTRLRLGSIEPWDVPERLWTLFGNARLAPHLHLPLQSGADSVLRRMGRRGTTAQYRRLVALARAAATDFNITTDIIVGFPGETEDEWRQTLDFVAEIGFGGVHPFPYSARPGTRAATLPNQIDRAVKKSRCDTLDALRQRIRAGYWNDQIGRRYPVLLEGGEAAHPRGTHFGYTPNYLPVRVPATVGGLGPNHIVEVRLSAIGPDRQTFLAEPIDLSPG